MVDIHMENKQAKIWFQGEPLEVAVEVIVAISGIYQGMHNMNEHDAEESRSVLAMAMLPGSPTWDRSHNMTMFAIPTEK